ncbi:UAA transporter domain containing protein [Aphelenchoides fujianensis]|nr:UAA transporter domain containing protein [Aphelenchoides fujianensis]
MLPTHKKDLESPKEEIFLFGCDLSRLPSHVQFLLLCAAVFVVYCGYGVMQEWIFVNPQMKPFGWYLTLFQFITYSLLGTAETRLTTDAVRRIPMKTYALLAFWTVCTMGFSNASVGYLNYPTQVIFKCCKLIPVLVGGILIQGKKFNVYDVSAAVLMSVGLIFFTLADNRVSPNFDPRGYVMISCALVADAIIGNVQEKTMKQHKASNCEVVTYSYSLGVVYLFVGTVISGEFFEAFAFFAKHPLETYGKAFLFSLLGYLGINIVLTLVRAYGALIAVTVTTMRKGVTIVLSFIFFSKPFSVDYLWAALVVLFAIYLNVYSKQKPKIDALVRKWAAPIGRSSKHKLDEKETLIPV